MDNKICILFSDGVEEMELIVPVDIFRRGKIDAVLVSAKPGGGRQITTAHGVAITADVALNEITPDAFDALVLPGGPSSFKLKDDAAVIECVKNFHKQNKLLCAICAAPLILDHAGVLEGKRYCAHPCTYETLPAADQESRVVVDDGLITASGPGVADEFALSIMEYLYGKPLAEKIATEMFL